MKPSWTSICRPALALQKSQDLHSMTSRGNTVPTSSFGLQLRRKECRDFRSSKNLLAMSKSESHDDELLLTESAKSQRLNLLQAAYELVQGSSTNEAAAGRLPIQELRPPLPPQRQNLPRADAETMLQRHRDTLKEGDVPPHHP